MINSMLRGSSPLGVSNLKISNTLFLETFLRVIILITV